MFISGKGAKYSSPCDSTGADKTPLSPSVEVVKNKSGPARAPTNLGENNASAGGEGADKEYVVESRKQNEQEKGKGKVKEGRRTRSSASALEGVPNQENTSNAKSRTKRARETAEDPKSGGDVPDDIDEEHTSIDVGADPTVPGH